MHCEACGREINTVTDSYYQLMTGWARVRSDGGPFAKSNAMIKPTREQRFRCSTCLGTEVDGQLSLV